MLELKERWRKTTKNDFIVSVLAKDDEDEILSNLINRYERRIKRVLQRKDEDIFLLAINIMTRQFDPHSTYLRICRLAQSGITVWVFLLTPKDFATFSQHFLHKSERS